MARYNVTVEWMDGEKREYVADVAKVSEGVLRAYDNRPYSGGVDGIVCVPLANVRTYNVQEKW